MVAFRISDPNSNFDSNSNSMLRKRRGFNGKEQ
jgi:hypothetical protein